MLTAFCCMSAQGSGLTPVCHQAMTHENRVQYSAVMLLKQEFLRILGMLVSTKISWRQALFRKWVRGTPSCEVASPRHEAGRCMPGIGLLDAHILLGKVHVREFETNGLCNC